MICYIMLLMINTRHVSLDLPIKLVKQIDEYFKFKNKEANQKFWSRNKIIRTATEEYMEKHILEVSGEISQKEKKAYSNV